MSNPTEKPNLSHLSKNWNSTIITRSNVEKWTGGLITAGYIAYLDAKGEGPPVKFRSCRKICYQVKPFIQWLENRSKLINSSSVEGGVQ